MSDYKSIKTLALEDRCFCLLNSLGLIVEKNNIDIITATDFICGDKYIDFQYSCDFKRYGDLRIDVVSAYRYKNGKTAKDRWTVQKNYASMDMTMYENSEFLIFLNTQIEIGKWGKVTNTSDKQYPNSIVYFIFHESENLINAETDIPDLIYFVKTKELFNYIKNNWKEFVKQKRLFLNEKKELGDIHGSAFFAIQLKELLENNIGYVIETALIVNNTIN